MNKDYLNLVDFWNKSFKLDENAKKELKSSINVDTDYKDLAPSRKQFEVLESFKDCKLVLDYGCGSGWASIIMAKSGAKQIDAFDVACNCEEMVSLYSEVFNVSNIINPQTIDEAWLSKEIDNKYDGFFCSNVIDVIPLEMAKDIIKESARITTKDAKVVYSLNYYIDPKLMEERGCKVDNSLVYIDGILRLNSLTDEEWSSLFKQYFKDVKLIYYAWPNENKEARRLFILSK